MVRPGKAIGSESIFEYMAHMAIIDWRNFATFMEGGKYLQQVDALRATGLSLRFCPYLI
jgi:hypothetical protein